jgi:hypothetical protein
MRYSCKFFCFLSLFLVSSCNFNQIVINPYDKGNYSVIADKSVPILLRNKIENLFNFNDEDNANIEAKIYIKNYSFQEYAIYAGSALRSLEGEITAKFQLEIQTSQKTHNKDIKIVKRYKSNELNPFAEKEMIKMVEKNIYKEILDEIIREVSSFEM